MHHRPVAQAQAGRQIRRVQDRADFLDRQMWDELLIMPFRRDGADLTDLLQGGGDLVFDITHECFDGGQAQIAGHRAVTAARYRIAQRIRLTVELSLPSSFAAFAKLPASAAVIQNLRSRISIVDEGASIVRQDPFPENSDAGH
jgi:hypothetical protein